MNIFNITKFAFIAFLILFFLIALIRIIFYILSLIFILVHPKKNNKDKNKKQTTNLPHDDALLRDIKKEKKNELKNVEKLSENLYDPNNNIEKKEDDKIVGIVKPIGYWTSLILGDKLSELLIQKQSMNKNGGGFWVNLITSKRKINNKEEELKIK